MAGTITYAKYNVIIGGQQQVEIVGVSGMWPGFGVGAFSGFLNAGLTGVEAALSKAS